MPVREAAVKRGSRHGEARLWRAEGCSGGFIDEDLVATDLSRRRTNEEGNGGARVGRPAGTWGHTPLLRASYPAQTWLGFACLSRFLFFFAASFAAFCFWLLFLSF